MPRLRATRHCKECKHHYQEIWPKSPHYCWHDEATRRISYGSVRTSPDWCPLGHILPGVPYPTFTKGKDPWKAGKPRTVHKRIKRNVLR